MSTNIRKQENPYTQVPNELINDVTISLKAKALYMIMASKPNGWVFSISRITKFANLGKYTVETSLRELKNKNWIYYKKRKDGGGNYIIKVDSKPIDTSPNAENQHMQKISICPSPENQDMGCPENQHMQKIRTHSNNIKSNISNTVLISNKENPQTPLNENNSTSDDFTFTGDVSTSPKKDEIAKQENNLPPVVLEKFELNQFELYSIVSLTKLEEDVINYEFGKWKDYNLANGKKPSNNFASFRYWIRNSAERLQKEKDKQEYWNRKNMTTSEKHAQDFKEMENNTYRLNILPDGDLDAID